MARLADTHQRRDLKEKVAVMPDCSATASPLSEFAADDGFALFTGDFVARSSRGADQIFWDSEEL
jgi:hypothetical protein